MPCLRLAQQENPVINVGEIDKEGNLMDTMLGCYTALEGRWSRGRQVDFLPTNMLVAN